MNNLHRAAAAASPNIAFVKYWGNRNNLLRIPTNGSISMTMGGLETQTTVTFKPNQPRDSLVIDGQSADPGSLQRMSSHLDIVRQLSGLKMAAVVESRNSFPQGAGIASSAAAYAALSLAASTAAGLELDPIELSRLARRGSGSAARSVFGGYVEWLAGEEDEDSYAQQLAAPTHWDLVDLVALTSAAHKKIGSSAGHALAPTSPLQAARVADSARRLDLCRQAILARGFSDFCAVVEQDSNMMHAVMMTSTPPLLYWTAETLAIMQLVTTWRSQGLHVCYTIDAGPNVHCICPESEAPEIRRRLEALPFVKNVLRSTPGGAARLL